MTGQARMSTVFHLARAPAPRTRMRSVPTTMAPACVPCCAPLEAHGSRGRNGRWSIQAADCAAFGGDSLLGAIGAGAEEAVDRAAVVAEARKHHLQRLQRVDLFVHECGPFRQRKTPPEGRGVWRFGARFNRRQAGPVGGFAHPGRRTVRRREVHSVRRGWRSAGGVLRHRRSRRGPGQRSTCPRPWGHPRRRSVRQGIFWSSVPGQVRPTWRRRRIALPIRRPRSPSGALFHPQARSRAMRPQVGRVDHVDLLLAVLGGQPLLHPGEEARVPPHCFHRL